MTRHPRKGAAQDGWPGRQRDTNVSGRVAQAAMIAKQGLPSLDWAGAFSISQLLKGGLSGGVNPSSVGQAALLGSAAKGAWYFAKAATMQTYYSAKSSFHSLVQVAIGCKDSLLPDFSSPN
jgi:hypothetical protein